MKPFADRHRGLLIAGAAVLVVLVSAGAAGLVAYRHLNQNIRSAPIVVGPEEAGAGSSSAPTSSSFSSGPVNLLLIGSDSRSTAALCKIGGDCSTGRGQNADVMMVMHLSADRTNATVMSIPRDTMTDLPDCEDPDTGTTTAGRFTQLNFSLDSGPACTVKAVKKLTGIPIDHFLMVDFTGVVDISDAFGGVNVCVSDDVYDTYSHLKLAKGDHTLKGIAALEFLRSRHAFGDGSDLGRTYAQHSFLSFAARKVQSTGVLLNPVTLYKLANAATKAVTVDPGLATVGKLVGLMRQVQRVPTSRITFVTMQSQPYPADTNRVEPAPAAEQLFAAIATDEPLTDAAAPTPAASRSPKATPTFGDGADDSPVKDAYPRTAAKGGCVPVSQDRTVQLNGVSMTPSQAYAAATDKADSAP